MTLNSVIFTDNLPTLDLHGLDRDTARVLINDFINDNYKLKNKVIVIVHGIGSGILSKATIDTLRVNKLVNDYKLNNFNSGMTLVELNLK